VPEDPATPAEPATKGSTTRELLLWHDRKFGHEATVSLARDLTPAAMAYINPTQPALGILSSSWYPVSVTNPMLSRVVESCGNEGREFAIEANREVVPRMIRGVYRVLFQATATPELYARHVGRLWRRLHTTGERSMVIRAPGEALSVLESWPAHHPLSCWLTIYTMAFVFEAMGYKKWTVDRRACVAHGAARCETILHYAK
jgi:hypothetical protein